MTLVSQIFSCKRCGYCCHGETTVSLNEKDQERMIKALNIPEEQVKNNFWRLTGKTVQMKTVEGHCVFYDDGCKVHNGRPWRCGQWPLHPSILSDENNFLTILDSCPGINKDISYEKFCQILRKLMAESDIKC
jgi:Fe-S-cluster containining protein